MHYLLTFLNSLLLNIRSKNLSTLVNIDTFDELIHSRNVKRIDTSATS